MGTWFCSIIFAASLAGFARADSVLTRFDHARSSIERLNGPSLCDPAETTLPLREFISFDEALKLFETVRDSKELYYHHPTNGCYAIAHIISDLFEKQGVHTRKIMIEGNLNFKTADAPDDKESVHWSWHVATSVKVKNPDGSIQDYVIDPATLERPEPVQSWKTRFTKQDCSEILPNIHTSGCQYYFTERYQRYPLFMTSGNLNTEWKSIELEEARNLMKWYQKTAKAK